MENAERVPLIKKLIQSPTLECVTAVFAVVAFLLDYIFGLKSMLLVVAVLGSIPTIWSGARSLVKGKISIDVFNSFALLIALLMGEVRSTVFIILMLTFAGLLDWYTESQRNRAVEEVLRLKPSTALRDTNGTLKEVPVAAIQLGDLVLVKEGARIPVDGVVIHGGALVNEASLTGESVPIEKKIGDAVFSSTLAVSGTMKVRAMRVGNESTVEQIAALIRAAIEHKSHSEKIADRFAGILLPLVLVVGALTYLITHNILMTASLFLVACADDIAVAIPLAMSAAIGRAAKRGVIIKGGEWLDALSRVETVVVDKTGTLTYGDIRVGDVVIKEGVSEKDFWALVGAAEKFSGHPVGRAIYKEALKHDGNIPDPDEFHIEKGSGVHARSQSKEIIIGNADIFRDHAFLSADTLVSEMRDVAVKEGVSPNAVTVDKDLWGYFFMRDVPRAEAKESIKLLEKTGVKNIVMFTGDNKSTAQRIASELGISNVMSEMKPELKLGEIEKLIAPGKILAMVGDGVNDAPALARADIGIAMGGTGTAIAIEAADMVILTDKLDRLPEMILLGKKTMSVIRADVIIWLATNIFGFYLVFSGIADPAFAAFYNFLTDFFPLINSARLFTLFRGRG